MYQKHKLVLAKKTLLHSETKKKRERETETLCKQIETFYGDFHQERILEIALCYKKEVKIATI